MRERAARPRPRDQTFASRALTALLGCGTALWLVPATWLTRAGVWILVPTSGQLVIAAVAVALPERVDLAHPLIGLTVLFAGSQLRPPAAALVTSSGIVVETALLAHTEPAREAAIDALFIGATLAATAILLVSLMNRLARARRALHDQASVDALTGLVTRRVLDDALGTALAATVTGSGTALILLDVDQFKSINDGLGHPVGDDALTHLADLLRRRVRVDDAVVARLGGDELAVVLPGCTTERAIVRAEQLVDAVRRNPLRLATGEDLPLSVSAGVAHAPAHATDVRGLYSAADQALYRAKRLGRDQVACARLDTTVPARAGRS